MDTRQKGNDEPLRAWLMRRVEEIQLGDGVAFKSVQPFKPSGVLRFAMEDKPAGSVTLVDDFFQVSLGRKPGELFPEEVIHLAGGAILKAQELGLETVHVNIANIDPDTVDPRFVLMGLQSALLRADELKTDVKSSGVKKVTVAPALWESTDADDALALARTSNVARWLAALPPNLLGVDAFHHLLLDLFSGQEVTLLGNDGQPSDEEYARMGLLNAVAQGNGGSRRVFAIRIDPESEPTEKVVAYVGKSLVYDSGGYSLKPSASMRTMKGDMTGGACLVGAALYLMNRRDQLTRSVVFVWTITKNMVGPDGYVPDDVLTAFSGKTVEVDNTDAEGRLALADAMAWICTKVPVGQLVPVCTLTGAAVIALGTAATAMHLKNSRRRMFEVARLEGLSSQVGDPVNNLHHFGLGGEILASKIADLKNAGGGKKDAGSQQGFAFLLAHAPDEVDVMELDIAGPAGDFSDSDGIQAGTGRPAGTWFIIACEINNT